MTLMRDPILALADAIREVALGNIVQCRAILVDVLATIDRDSQPSLPGVPAAEPRTSSDEGRRAAVSRLFAYWQERCEHRQAKLTPERARSVLARLRDGYTESELRKAIDGAATAAYVSEDTGQRYDDLTLICRNGSKLESFIARGVKSTGAVEVAPVDESSPVEDQISDLRRRMADMKRDGRGHEYEQAAGELQKLMQRRAR